MGKDSHGVREPQPGGGSHRFCFFVPRGCLVNTHDYPPGNKAVCFGLINHWFPLVRPY